MLANSSKGYAVMTPDLSAYSFESESLAACEKYCRNGDVIAEQIPKCHGFSIRIYFMKFDKRYAFNFKHGLNNILWLNWSTSKVFFHKTGKIVYRSNG